MKWTEFVNEFDFSPNSTLAAGLAALLDADFLNPTNTEKGGRSVAKLRLKLFDEFCAVCVQSGIPAPLPEESTLRALLPGVTAEVLAEAQAICDQVMAATNKMSDDPFDDPVLMAVRSRAFVIDRMPWLLTDFAADRDSTLASLNLCLMSLNLPLVRPNFAAMELRSAVSEPKPPRPLKVLVVDDSLDEVVRTLRALVAWPDLDLDAFHFRSDWSAPRDAESNAAAAEVLKRRPDLVLMDQGLGPIKGSDLIRRIRETMTEMGIR